MATIRRPGGGRNLLLYSNELRPLMWMPNSSLSSADLYRLSDIEKHPTAYEQAFPFRYRRLRHHRLLKAVQIVQCFPYLESSGMILSTLLRVALLSKPSYPGQTARQPVLLVQLDPLSLRSRKLQFSEVTSHVFYCVTCQPYWVKIFVRH